MVKIRRARAVGRALALKALTVALAAGCGLSPTAVPSAPVETASAGAVVAPAIRDAMAWRHTLGLREDESYVVSVQADPVAVELAANKGFEFAVTAAEAAALAARLDRMHDVARSVEEYGEAHPSEWAGLIVAPATGGVIAQFKDHLEDHRQAIDHLLMPGANVTLRQVAWSTQELKALVALVANDRTYFTSVGATLDGYGVDEANNVALIDVLSLDPDVADQVIAHFGAAGRMKVRVSDLLPWQGGWADVEVRVVLKAGQPAGPNLDCDVSSNQPFTYPQWSPTDHDGVCAFRLEATNHVVQISRKTANGRDLLGEREIRVIAGIDARVIVQLDGP